jgi:hypothetical protein
MAHQRSFRRNSELIHREVANSSSRAGARTAPVRGWRALGPSPCWAHHDAKTIIPGKIGNRKHG